MKTFLHVGCGPARKPQAGPGFLGADWQELRLDIDPSVHPDIVGSMTDMSAVADRSVDAIFSSHNIEHLYSHEVGLALAEFKRVLKDDGFAVVTCPDLQSVCALVAEDKLLDTAYVSPAGPIVPLDILYGLRSALAAGNLYMAHRVGFTLKVLMETLTGAGFQRVAGRRRPQYFDLYVIATKNALSDQALQDLANIHLPL